MIEPQDRPFGKDNDVMAFRQRRVRLSHQFPENTFPSVPDNRLAEPTPRHNADPGLSETRRTGDQVEVWRRDALAFPFDSIEILSCFQEERGLSRKSLTHRIRSDDSGPSGDGGPIPFSRFWCSFAFETHGHVFF